MKNPTRIGILGCGNVGSALVYLLTQEPEEFVVQKIAVNRIDAPRQSHIDISKLTADSLSVVTDQDVDIVVELIGGLTTAKELIEIALENKKPVVTANKELMAKNGFELLRLAKENGVDLLFEASVCGAIPIVRLLKESLVGEEITRIIGILNGTTNYILTKMSEEKLRFDESLQMAQSLGYAEKDPTADIKGYDAGAKAAILTSSAFITNVDPASVYIEGITDITVQDIEFASKNGMVIKLVAVIEKIRDGNLADLQISIRVHPVMIGLSHPLASVRNSYNAIFIEGEAIGEMMLYGKGAGGLPTASAVLGDILDAKHNISLNTSNRFTEPRSIPIFDQDDLSSEFYIAVDVSDEPGVLANVATVFGSNRISIASMEQNGFGQNARLVFLTHSAKEADMKVTVNQLSDLDCVKKVGSVIRVMAQGI